MPLFPFGSTITIHRRTGSTAGRDGAQTYVTTPILIPGCAVWPRVSAETVQGQDLVITGITVFAPAGTVVLATDTVTVDGLTYNVVGDPGSYSSPLTGTRSGVEVQLLRATG